MAYQGGPDLDAALARAGSTAGPVAGREAASDFVHIRELLERYWEPAEAESRAAAGHIRTGFVDLDKLLGGLKRSDLIILAARPSLGKTSLALNIARNAAVGQERRVAIFSLEMAAEQLAQRLLAASPASTPPVCAWASTTSPRSAASCTPSAS